MNHLFSEWISLLHPLPIKKTELGENSKVRKQFPKWGTDCTRGTEDGPLGSGERTYSSLNHFLCGSKAMVFPVVMYGCESWTVKKLSAKKLVLLNCGVGEDC